MTRITTRVTALYVTESRISRPVWAFLIVEALVAGAALISAGTILVHLVQAVDLEDLPPWRGLACWPVAGIACYTVRAARPIEVTRRWHGVVVRRIDERWAADR